MSSRTQRGFGAAGVVALLASPLMPQDSMISVLVLTLGVTLVVLSFWPKAGVRERAALMAAQVAIAYEWWSAGMSKILGGKFAESFNDTVAFFASENPFSGYKAYLEAVAMDGNMSLAHGIMWGQALVGAVLLISALWRSNSRPVKHVVSMGAAAALFGGLLMNANFYFAAGWTGPGTKGLNVVMFWVQLVLMAYWSHKALCQGSKDNSSS